MGSAIAKIASAGACVRTSVPLVSLADLAEGNVVDFDTLLGKCMYYSKAVKNYKLCAEQMKALSTKKLSMSILKTLNTLQFEA